MLDPDSSFPGFIVTCKYFSKSVKVFFFLAQLLFCWKRHGNDFFRSDPRLLLMNGFAKGRKNVLSVTRYNEAWLPGRGGMGSDVRCSTW